MATIFLSPIGEFEHPWINKPDTKFNDDGLFKVDLILSGKDAQELKRKIDGASLAALNEHIDTMPPGKAKKWSAYHPYEEVEDDEGNLTGEIKFFFKQNRIINLRDGGTKEVSIEVRDSQDKVIEVNIFGGSEGRIMFSTRAITMQSAHQVGVRLDFYKVQITKLAKSSSGGKGFGAVEGGYQSEAEDAGFGSTDEDAGDY